MLPKFYLLYGSVAERGIIREGFDHMFQVALASAAVTVWWPGLTLLGLFIGFLTGMFGVGGGFLLTPFLNIFFGISYPIAIGSGLAQIFLTGAASAWKHWRNHNVDPVMGVILAGGALGGTEIGVCLLKKLTLGGTVTINGHVLLREDLLMSGFFLILMIIVALHIFSETSGSNQAPEVNSTIAARLQKYRIAPMLALPKSRIVALSLWIPLALSFGVGILTGLLGVGGGFIVFPLLVYVLGVPTAIAVGTSAFQILFATGYGAYRHAVQGHVELILVGLLLVGSLIGVQLGVYATRFCNGPKVRRCFAYVIALGIVVILGDWILKTIF